MVQWGRRKDNRVYPKLRPERLVYSQQISNWSCNLPASRRRFRLKQRVTRIGLIRVRAELRNIIAAGSPEERIKAKKDIAYLNGYYGILSYRDKPKAWAGKQNVY